MDGGNYSLEKREFVFLLVVPILLSNITFRVLTLRQKLHTVEINLFREFTDPECYFNFVNFWYHVRFIESILYFSDVLSEFF